MALYKETSYDDWARRQRQSLQNSAQNLQQKQAGLQAAQNQKQKTTLESALSGLIGGLKERGSDILNTANNIGKTVVGAVGDTAQRIGLKSAQKDDSKRRNEIAKKYGFNSYSEAANSGNASEAFWNEIKDTNKQTKQKLESNKANLGSYGDVTKVNTNEAKGQALNTIDSVLGLLPGGLGVAANIAGGGLSGIGDEYKRAGREGDNFDWQNARNNAIVGAAGGLAGSAGGAGMGKFASKAGTNALGKLAGTQLAKGIAGGAAAGAVGGGLGTYLNGGSLEDALLAAKEGAKAGGIGGGVMAGAMGLGGKALDKFRGRTGSAPVTDIEPVEATAVQKNRIDQPTTQRIEAEAPSTRRGIAITDLDAGEQTVNVRNGRPTENRGKYIDSFVKRADANLPEANKAENILQVLYHGSPEADITSFDLSRAGKNTRSGEKAIYFTDSMPVAEDFSYERIPTDSMFVENKGKKGKVYKAALDMGNTLDLDNITDSQIEKLWDYASPLAKMDGKDNFVNTMKKWRDNKNPQLMKSYLDFEALPNSGYDSFTATMYPNSGNTAKEYAVFDPNRVNMMPEGGWSRQEQRFIKEFGSPLEKILSRGGMGDGIDIIDTLKASGVREPELAAIKSGARSYANDTNPFAAYGMTSRGDLPLLDRQEYYNDNMGKIGRAGNGGLTTEDVPRYMQDRLKNDAGKGRYSSADNESIMREVFGDNMSKEDMYRLYEELADTTQASPYTSENFGYALSLDPELSARVQRAMLEQAAPTRKISIESALTQAQPVDITDMTTNYRKSTIPARQYEQTVNNIPEAQTTANRAVTSAPEAQVMPQVESGKATGWGDKSMTNASKKRNLLQKIGDTLQETGQATKDSQVYSKLKGNLAEDMARKNSVERLRELGFNSTDYDKAANLSEVVNKYYDDAVKQTKQPVEAPQLRNIAREVADDLHISSANRADLEKLVNTMLDDAVAKDGKMTGLTMDRFTPADLEKVAKNLGQKAENITTTNYGGRKKAIRNLTPDNEEYARALGEVRNRLRNEIGEMADYNGAELAARMKDAGATQKQIDYVTNGGTLRSAKAATSLFEDARNMAQQIKSDSYKRGANATNSTNFVTQVANASGASNAVNMLARPVANAIGSVEKVAGKAISGLGNALAGDSEALKGAGKAAANIAGKAGEKIGNATANLNNETLSNIGLNDGLTLGTYLTNQANRQIGYGQARDAQERMANAQALSQAQNDYNDALASYQNEEQQVNNAIAQAQAMQSPLGRIEQAMTLALNAGDINAYSQLADLYQQAAKIEELKNPTSKTEGKALSANQAKALTAQQQLDMLATMKPNAGTVAANIPGINKIVNLTGGNEYDNQADALATTLGYLLSGANIKESEAKRIGKAYVPTAFDSEAVRQQKLDRAAQLIQSYMSDTGALAA